MNCPHCLDRGKIYRPRSGWDACPRCADEAEAEWRIYKEIEGRAKRTAEFNPSADDCLTPA